MADKKTTGAKKPAKSSGLSFSRAEIQKLAESGKKNMKRLGIKTPEEYIAHIDKRRGY